jgi:hypothetical protein
MAVSFFLNKVNDTPDGPVKDAIQIALQKAQGYFKNMSYDGEWPDQGYGLVTMRPYHVVAGDSHWGSSDYWASCFVASVTWEDWINITQTDLAYQIITGMFNFEIAPKDIEVYFTADGKDIPTLSIEEMYTFDPAKVYWRKPFVVQPEKTWAFYHKGMNTGIEREGLLGYTLATRTYLILRG